MKITKDVILDLLPLYTAGEVSPDTKALVDAYLKTDAELAKMVKESSEMRLPDGPPAPMTREDQMKAYVEAKKWMFWKTFVIAVAISFSILGFTALMMLMFMRPSF